MQISRGFVLRRVHLLAIPLASPWAWITIYGMGSMLVAGVTATLLLSGVTICTGIVFWRARERVSSDAAPVLARRLILWGLHHLDYPLLRGFGAAVLYGVFADVLFLFAIGLGLLFVVLSTERERLAARSSELEQLTRLMLRVQEDERRRIARELHDEAGQVLTAVKIELELGGRHEAGAMVGRALAQVRDLSNLLRPSGAGRSRAGRGAAGAGRRLLHPGSDRGHARAGGCQPPARAGCGGGDLPCRAGGADQRRPARARLRRARPGQRRQAAT